ncbi:transporter, YbiR family [Longilinea arvoryzae]|uniref:Transporter, YbiR family n=1 Tax=Longilinea arvoryzae TaxID=360412 RepID=A0A0S7BJX6_9CHLR|nr:anion transporter [Longilinea arvoryzae]GAP14251.1 transporter, YbiR family [Longilinea arvoryzae]
MNFWLTLGIVLFTYIGIALGYWPRLRANRTTITLMGAGLLIATSQIAFKDIGQFLDLDTLILLFSMMVINANLRIAGFFKLAGNALLRVARTPRALLAVLILVTGVLSAFFLNDTICLMLTPLVLDLILATGRNPIPYLIGLATAANIGSTATLTGNPQNMIIGVASGISYTHFAASLAPIALLGLGVVWIVLVLAYPKEFRTDPFSIHNLPTPRFHKPLLIKSLLVMAGLLVAFLIGMPIAKAAFLAACILLFTRRLKPEKVFAEFDWSILVFFAALFIVTGSLEKNGVTKELFKLALGTRELNNLSLSTLTVVLSNLVSNVPAVLLLKPVVLGLGNPTAGWLTLAAASTLAGNLTLLGSVANLIVAEIAERRRVHLSFWEYTRVGMLITLITLVISTLWLQFFVWRG